MTPTTIDSFSGEYRFLSNFWPANVSMDGVNYPSVEHAFQAAKTTSAELRKMFLTGTAGQAKKKGRGLPLRPDWESIKTDVMRRLLISKFCQRYHPDLASMLIATNPSKLIEGNTWGDRCWGVCDGVGENRLGRLLMEVRDVIMIDNG